MAKSISFGGTFNKNKPESKPKKTRTVKYPSGPPNLERDAAIDLTELQKDFKEAARKETALKDANTDSESFSVIVFKTSEQRDKFAELLGLKSPDNQYLDGQKLIKALEMKIDIIKLKNPGRFKCNAEILNLASEL